MTIGGLLFIIGAALQAGAVHLAMLIVGRVMLGFGVGLANQVGLLRAVHHFILQVRQVGICPQPLQEYQLPSP